MERALLIVYVVCRLRAGVTMQTHLARVVPLVQSLSYQPGRSAHRVVRVLCSSLMELPQVLAVLIVYLPVRDSDVRQHIRVHRKMNGKLLVELDLIHVLALAEASEELRACTQDAPLAKCIDVVIVGVVKPVLFEVCNTLLVVEAVLAIWRADNPEVIEVGALNDNRIGRVLFYLQKFFLHQKPLHLRKLLRHLLPAYGGRHGYLVKLLLVEVVLLYPVHLTDWVEGHYYLLALLTAQTLAYLFEVLNVELAEFLQLHTLVVRYALYLLRIVET